MSEVNWFIFDLGNTVIRLAYERVLENICRRASVSRDELVDLLEEPGSYRDMERGDVTFAKFYDFMSDKAGYRGSLHDFQPQPIALFVITPNPDCVSTQALDENSARPFLNHTRPDAYRPQAAADAFERAVRFFEAHLSART